MNTMTASDGQARLDLEWRMNDTARRGFELDYTFSNTAGMALALIDRGDRRRPGEAKPQLLSGPEGMTISLAAAALPDPAPTYPDVPLARQIAAGGRVQGALALRIPATMPGQDAAGRPIREPVRRVRFCVGYAVFEGSDFVAFGEDWIPSVRVIRDRQHTLCTPWIDLPDAA